MIREILKLGNPMLYEQSEEIKKEEKSFLPKWVEDLHDTLMEYRRVHGAGHALFRNSGMGLIGHAAKHIYGLLPITFPGK